MLKRGSQLGQYRVVRLIGEGGMGEVYEAVHMGLNKHVALKTLRQEVDTGLNVHERFLREGRAAARLRHPHIVDVFDAGEVDGTVFLVMELLEGEDLGDKVKREGPLAHEAAVDLMLPVMAAVGSVHDQGIIHRDLKPANVFLARGPYGEPLPKVLDFGISKITTLDHALTASGDALGSPFYMSPEQARGLSEIDARSDQYSLGVILYEVMTGELPFVAANLPALLYAIQNETAASPRTLVPQIPPGLDAVIMRALERNPENRFPTCHELGRALLPFAGERSRLLWAPAFERACAGPPAAEPRPRRASDRSRPAPDDAAGRPPSPHDPTPPMPMKAPRIATRVPERTESRAEMRAVRVEPKIEARADPKPRSGHGTVRPPQTPAPSRQPTPAPPRHAPTPPPVARLAAPRAPQAKSVAVISVSDPDAVQAVMKRLLDAEGLVMLCEAKGPTPLERIPLSRVVEAIGDQVELIVLADDGGGWRDPMSELCRTLAPERYDAKSSYLFFERGELVHGIKRDLFDALSDAEKITDFLAGRVSGVQRFKRQKDY